MNLFVELIQISGMNAKHWPAKVSQNTDLLQNNTKIVFLKFFFLLPFSSVIKNENLEWF